MGLEVEMRWIVALLVVNAWLTYSLHKRLSAIFQLGDKGRWPAPYQPPPSDIP